MFVTPDFVFVHVPKTGGKWVESVIPKEWLVEAFDAHAPRRDLPERYEHLPSLAFARNPWDWYVSFYEYNRHRDPSHSETHELFYGGGTFESFLSVACFSPFVPDAVGAWMREFGIDYYTSLLCWMAGPGQCQVRRFENLREEFLGFLNHNKIPVSAEIREAIETSPPVNASDRLPYRDYYTDETGEWVARAARPIIRSFGYQS